MINIKIIMLFAIIDLKKYKEVYEKNDLEYYLSNFRNNVMFLVSMFNYNIQQSDMKIIEFIDIKINEYDNIGYDSILKLLDNHIKMYLEENKIKNSDLSKKVEFGNFKK